MQRKKKSLIRNEHKEQYFRHTSIKVTNQYEKERRERKKKVLVGLGQPAEEGRKANRADKASTKEKRREDVPNRYGKQNPTCKIPPLQQFY